MSHHNAKLNVLNSTLIMMAVMLVAGYLFAGFPYKLSTMESPVIGVFEDDILPRNESKDLEWCEKSHSDNMPNCLKSIAYLQEVRDAGEVPEAIKRFRAYQGSWLSYLAPPSVHQYHRENVRMVTDFIWTFADRLTGEEFNRLFQRGDERSVSLPFSEVKLSFSPERLPWILLMVSFVVLSVFSILMFWLLFFVTMPLSKNTVIERLRSTDAMRSLALTTSLVVTSMFITTVYLTIAPLMFIFSLVAS